MSDHVVEPEHPQRPEASVRADPVTITVCPDGPLLVRGPAHVIGVDGEALPRERSTVALCRCGRSSLAPWCDGSHKVARPAGSSR